VGTLSAMFPNRSTDVPTQGQGSDSWFNGWRFGSVLGLLIALFFAPVIAGWETFSFLDSGLFAYPVAFHLRDSLWRGEFPLWNPLSNCGVPFAAQWNTLAMYPPSLFYVLLPMPWSFNVFCLGHLVLAGVGMYFLAQRWTGSQLGAALAGVVFAFNGLTWWGLMWPHIIAALAWMPWLILTMEKAWCEGGQHIIRASIIGAMQMLSGGAEAILQTWLFIVVLAGFALARKELCWTKLTPRLVLTGLLVFGLSAVQLLPFLDLLANSQRSGTYADATTAAMAPYGWANFLVPLFHHCRNVQDIFVPTKLSWTGSYYLGIGTILMAAYAIWRNRGPRVWFLAGVTLFSLLMALGSAGVIYSVIKSVVPFLGFIRFPVKFVMLATFALPLIAAFGVARWRQQNEAKPAEWRPMKVLVFALVAAVAVLALIAWTAPLPKDDPTATIKNAASRAALLGGFVAMLALIQKPNRWRTLAQIGVVILAWVDIYTQGSNLSPTVPSPHLEPNVIRKALGWETRLSPGISRAMLSPQAMGKMLTAGSSDPVVDTQGRRLALYMNFNLLDSVPKIDSLWSLELRDYEVIRNMYFAPAEPTRLEDFLGVSHVSSRENATQWVERDSYAPMITAGQQVTYANPEETLKTMYSGQFDPRQMVFLPPEARSTLGERAATRAQLLATNFSTHRICMDIQAEAETMVVVAQAFYHCWQGYIDGKRTPIWKANAGFQAVGVPAGKHRLELVYVDSMFRSGSVISGLCWTGCVPVWFWLKRRR